MYSAVFNQRRFCIPSVAAPHALRRPSPRRVQRLARRLRARVVSESMYLSAVRPCQYMRSKSPSDRSQLIEPRMWLNRKARESVAYHRLSGEMISYLGYFGLNYSVELLVARLGLPACGLKRLVTAIFVLNLATHPLLWFLLGQEFNAYWTKLLVGEVLVCIVEASLGLLLFAATGATTKRIILTVLASNLLSFSFTFIV